MQNDTGVTAFVETRQNKNLLQNNGLVPQTNDSIDLRAMRNFLIMMTLNQYQLVSQHDYEFQNNETFLKKNIDSLFSKYSFSTSKWWELSQSNDNYIILW